MAKYKWNELKKEYLLGDYKSIKTFCKDKNIPYNGNTKVQTNGWSNEKGIKEAQKSDKIIEKVIEKEAEKEAKKIVNVKDTAEALLIKINESIGELNKYYSRDKKKSKTVEYDYKVGKPKKEITEEIEEIREFQSIIDKLGLKNLASALKDVNDILEDKLKDPEDEGVIIVDDLPKLE